VGADGLRLPAGGFDVWWGIAQGRRGIVEGHEGIVQGQWGIIEGHEGLRSELAVYGYDEAGLSAARAMVEAMAAADQAQEQAKGANLLATSERDEAYKAMTTWMGTFKRVARRALRERPDLLAALGM